MFVAPKSTPVTWGCTAAVVWPAGIVSEAGDIVTFAVGYGKNQTNFGDTTGLFARVVLLGGADSRR